MLYVEATQGLSWRMTARYDIVTTDLQFYT